MQVIVLLNAGEAYEYYCPACKQLRLACGNNVKSTACGNCGSPLTVIGKINTLDRAKLQEGIK